MAEAPEGRIRSLSEKAQENYEERVNKYMKSLDSVADKMQNLIQQSRSEELTNSDDLKSLHLNICLISGEYRAFSSDFNVFLENTRTEQSLKMLAEQRERDSVCELAIKRALEELDKRITDLQLDRQSLVSGRSRKSSTSQLATQARAKASAARARMTLIDKEKELKRRQLDIEIELKALKEEQIYEEAKAEAVVYEDAVSQWGSGMQAGSLRNAHIEAVPAPNLSRTFVMETNHQSEMSTARQSAHEAVNILPTGDSRYVPPRREAVNVHISSNPVDVQPPRNPDLVTGHIPTQDSVARERTREYVNSLQTENLLNPNADEYVPCDRELNVTSELSRFLLRKDLLFSRLTKYDDKAENYSVWKTTFKSVVAELNVNSREELDLLVKWLGPDSVKHAISYRTSSSSDPARGVRNLWERLDERYGAPEMTESSLQKKLENFPRLGPKDSKKLYELADILQEIQNNMADPKYADLLSYFNSSRGVIPIVNKLPYNMQEKWTTRAAKYKADRNVPFPPFCYFVNFVTEMSKVKNDPGFMYESQQKISTAKRVSLKTEVSTNSEIQSGNFCTFHNVAGHTLNSCRTFQSKPMTVRKKFIRDKGICFRCCEYTTHKASNCTKKRQCNLCKGPHASALHLKAPSSSNGGEKSEHDYKPERKENEIHSACAQVCGNMSGGKSCAKLVCVYVYPMGDPEKKVKIYALLDDQSNRSLVKPEFFNLFDGQFEEIAYSLSSCVGKIDTYGRRATGFVVENLDGTSSHELPPLTECTQIPDIRDEIPTPAVARAHSHLTDLADSLPELDREAPILLLIGRDLAEAHHVLKQIIGPRRGPFAQEYSLGWVIIGESCLGEVHVPDKVCCNKTYIGHDGRGSIFPPCQSRLFLKERHDVMASQDVFVRTPEDDKFGLSAEDEEFLGIMNRSFQKTPKGWSAPLPFRDPRPKLPNNRDQVLRRSHSLKASLRRDSVKQDLFVEFMGRIFDNGYAELAPPLQLKEECWYLPIFGVYNSRKGQIRVVFDSAAQHQGISLNSVLMQGPNLMNSLLGVLMRFRRHPVAVTADIQQMFFQFRVHEAHRNYLRFIWFKNNDPEQELVEYRMCSHVFGNSPSPAIAAYGLKKTAAEMEPIFGSDVREFVEKDFYVDDGLSSYPDEATAIDLVTRTQKALKEGGNLRLHKIASNSEGVMKAFPKEDLAKELQDIKIGSDTLPTQRSLGMNWNLETDTFTYTVSKEEKPVTRRGVLSTVNSLFDPLGFVAPVVNQGRLLMRELIHETSDWDQPLPEAKLQQWKDWKKSLADLERLTIPRMYVEISNPAGKQEIHIFSDASEKAISAVAYYRVANDSTGVRVGFILGKSKVAPRSGHTIPRLELCAAVMAVEIAETVYEQLGFPIEEMKFYTDSRVVLGYLNNKVRRFYIYVQNRIARILKSTTREQWYYVGTDDNPADEGTRPIPADQLQQSMWLKGCELLKAPELHLGSVNHELQSPDEDRDIRPLVKCVKTVTDPSQRLGLDRFKGINKWDLLVRVIALLKGKAGRANIQAKVSRADLLRESERILITEVQKESFSKELECIASNQKLPRNSAIQGLNPIIDEHGLLRIGGRLKNASELSISEKNPVILPKCHFVSKLVVRYYHESVRHQGCNFTEGAIRSGGFWIIGVKRLVRGMIHECVKCRKLRGKAGFQFMSDLPKDRLTPDAPFSSVGVDVFGPWNVTARRTRGGLSHSKRWAVLYTCLTTRAVHIELIEELSSSSFINATRRFIAIRGPVRVFRSDRGTNFVGATDCMKIDAINVEDETTKKFFDSQRTVWLFNSPHSSHMGGVWERLISIVRRILDSMLVDLRGDLTHEVLATFMAEVCSIINSRPLVTLSADPECPTVLSPAMLLTQKPADVGTFLSETNLRDMYKAQWRRVQCLSNMFWKRWKAEYLQKLQQRKKWTVVQRELRVGDVVLLIEDDCQRNNWPMGVITELYPSQDGHVRKVMVKVNRTGDSEPRSYVRPVTKLITLLECEDKISVN
ncbi:uncharacterized protein LOC128547190 [Mercenaria mercenaria]|uniref:uncharacterized protein LOC128547190 n=1 Tax=Mercenaria mercenaria TaxID=6596 RepID=UPI00234F5764|nr:uncharacterized protein LOC128547190 [Mercenaria mercenaria]